MQTNGTNGHQHEVSEKRPTPDIFTTRIDMEICICGGQAVGGPGRRPSHPMAFHQPGDQPNGKGRCQGGAADPSQVSAGRGLSPAGVADSRWSWTTPGRSRRPTTRARAGVPRHGCTPAGQRCCWSARRCKQS